MTDGIEYFIVRSKRKTVAIEINRQKGVLLRVPLRFPEKKAGEIISAHKPWIVKKLNEKKKSTVKKEYSEEQKKILKLKAKEVILPLVLEYSEIMELYPTAVKINFAKTRFGSCSGKNSLNFSAYLLEYEKEAIEYVVVHELAHITYKNHSKEFYKLVEKYLPDYKNRKKLLKR